MRNDSDIHLEGVLLDGEGNHTSPEGSNWSLNSCSSSQSNKSQDNPPSYFQVNHDSWEDCNAHHLLMSQCPSKNGQYPLAQNLSNPKLTTNGSLTSSCIITTSMINSTTTLPSSSLTNGTNGSLGGFNGSLSKSQSSPHSQSIQFISPSTITLATNSPKENGSSSYSANGGVSNGGVHGRTSPVAVPVPNRLTFHNQTRPDSNSSASIGRFVSLILSFVS